MLATHPQIAGTVAESHLFTRGVGALFDNHARREQYEGFLSNYVSEAQLADLVRDFCDGVLGAMRDRVKPGAAWVAEKTPAPRYGADTVIGRKLAVYPDATYIHVVRERDGVVRSLLRAPWADVDEAEAERWWNDAVEATRTALSAAPAATSIELSYERLAAEPVDTVLDLFGQLGLERGDEVRARLESVSRERISSFGPPSASGERGGSGAEGAGPAAATPAAVGGGRGVGGATERSPLRAKAAEVARRVGARAGRRTALAQALLVAARNRDADEVAALTHPSFSFELRSGGGDSAAAGEAGRAALVALAGELFRSQAVSESWTVVSEGELSVLLLAILHGDGSRADLAFAALVRGGLVERLAVISAGDPGGRSPAGDEGSAG